jgi:hypothetical protein
MNDKKRAKPAGFTLTFLFTHRFNAAFSQDYFRGQVFKPTNVYNGQKLTRLVNTNTPPRITIIKPSVPVTVPLKYK